MIDPSNVNSSRAMHEDKFKEIAHQGEDGPLINVVEVPARGWAIFGPYGVFEQSDGTRTFQDLADIHKRLEAWGFERFVEGGQFKQF